jgi:hypothetical protein
LNPYGKPTAANAMPPAVFEPQYPFFVIFLLFFPLFYLPSVSIKCGSLLFFLPAAAHNFVISFLGKMCKVHQGNFLFRFHWVYIVAYVKEGAEYKTN